MDWRAARERAKFSDLPRFADGLPRLRRSLKKMLTSDDPDTLAVASIVRLLDQGGLRVGHVRPHDDNPAIGATTLQPEHIDMDEDRIDLSYTAKGGKERDVTIEDEPLAEAINRLISLSDDDEDYIFETESGRCSASRVNDFLQDRLGARFSAKDFRTWGGSVAAARVLRKTDKPTIKMLSEAAADWLGNTPTIARNSYIHPAIIDAREHGLSKLDPSGPTRLRADERFCYAVITA
jgi:DNA topoisomerase-1